MYSELRKATRIYPKDFSDYTVNIEINGFLLKGYLGNISSGGLCAIMNQDFPLTENSVINGFLMDEPFKQNMPFSGKIVWISDYLYKKDQKKMLGVEFNEKVNFPERLEAISIAIEE